MREPIGLDSSSVMAWIEVNKHKFHLEKTEVLLARQPETGLSTCSGIGSTSLVKEEVSGLSIFLDLALNLDVQMITVARNSFNQFRLVCQLPLLLDQADLALVTHDLVTSRLDYCTTPLLEAISEHCWKTATGLECTCKAIDWCQGLWPCHTICFDWIVLCNIQAKNW